MPSWCWTAPWPPRQVIDFAPNISAQLGQDPYTPSTLVLAAPPTTATITGFTCADRIVLSNVSVTSASYAGSSLSVFTSGGDTLTYTVTGDLAGLTLDASAASQGIIQFDPPVSRPCRATPSSTRSRLGLAP